MYVLGINGSPRKRGNTATLLQETLRGAEASGATTECVHLYDLSFKGCVSCFACKRKGGKSYGACACRDELTPLLEKIKRADALALASPIYFMHLTACMRAFLERLLYPYLCYTKDYASLFPHKLPVACLYTMNLSKAQAENCGLSATLELQEIFLAKVFGNVASYTAYDTYQFDKYDDYVATSFDAAEKARQRREQFPLDRKEAYSLGHRLFQEPNNPARMSNAGLLQKKRKDSR